MIRLLATLALLAAPAALWACGESAQEKAERTVCTARTDIRSKVEHLHGLTASSQAITDLKTDGEAIGEDLKRIATAEKELSGARRQEVQSAVEKFERESAEAFASLQKGGSAAQLLSELSAGLQGLQTAYQQSLASLKCTA